MNMSEFPLATCCLKAWHWPLLTCADFEIMCRHQSVSVHLPRMTHHKCTWLVGVTINMHEYNLLFSGAWHLTTHGFKPANLFFLSFLYAWVLVNQFPFFPRLFFPHTSYICTTQPVFESSLDNTFSCLFDLFLVFGMTLHILNMTTQNLSARTYDCSTIILIFLKAVNTAGYTVTLILSCMGPVYEGAGQGLWNQNRILFQCSFKILCSLVMGSVYSQIILNIVKYKTIQSVWSMNKTSCNLVKQFFEWEILFYPGLLGVRQYGVHMNGFFYDADGEVKMWIGRRSPTKPTYPGMLDNTVGKWTVRVMYLFNDRIGHITQY